MSTAVQDRPSSQLRPPIADSPPVRTENTPPGDDHSSPWFRGLGFAAALLVLAGAVALIFGPARGMRSDIDRQVELTTTQLEMTREQLAITRRQLAIAEEQRLATLETLGIAREQLAVAYEQLARTREAIQMQREALGISRETLEEAREVNRKTPDANPRGGVLEGQP